MRVKIPKSKLWRAIRAKCLDCCGNQQTEVRLCPAENCPLHPYRMGRRQAVEWADLPKNDQTVVAHGARTENTTCVSGEQD